MTEQIKNLRDIGNLYTTTVGRLTEEQLNEFRRRLVDALNMFLEDMEIMVVGENAWKAFDVLPDTCTLPDRVSDAMQQIQTWLDESC